MTSTTNGNGRLCNQIIRNMAVHFIAKKYDLYVSYSSQELIEQLGIELFCGTHTYSNTISLTDTNYFLIYNSQLYSNINPNNNFFQTKPIIYMIYQYLQSLQSTIIQKNPYQSRYNNNNDLYVHVRLTDVAHYNPGFEYYQNMICTIQYDKLYLSTDDKTHQIVTNLLETYQGALIEYNEVQTIQFASTCRHIMLSHGTFSAMIGYLSFFSTIYYPKEKHKWYGDLYIDSWKIV